MFESLMGNRRPLANSKSLSHKRAKSDIKKIVSERFIAAREMNGFSQSEAAEKIGYKTSTQLCLWEQGKRLPPIDQMLIVCMVYGVSLDYLYGLSDEPERDPRMATQQAMMMQVQDMLKANAQAVTCALLVQVRAGGPSMATVRALHARASESAAAIRRFQELNKKKFECMPGSNTLMVTAAALEDCTREAMEVIVRHDSIKRQSTRRSERAFDLSYPLFETPEYRQGQLGMA